MPAVMPTPLLAALLSLGMALRGFDSVAGQGMSCIVNASLLAWLLHRKPPGVQFWRRALPVLALIIAAIVWGLLASLQFDGTWPDYVTGKFLSLLSGVAALLCGAIWGGQERSFRGILDWLLAINCVILLGGLVLRQVGTDALPDYWTITREGRFTGLIGNANVTAAIAGSMAIIAFARLTDFRGAPVWAGDWRPGHILNLPMFVISFGVVILTAARFTTMMLCAILGLFVLHWLSRRTTLIYTRLTATIAGLAFATIIGLFADMLIDRFDLLGTAYRDRVTTWAHLADVAGESPTYGYGLGSFPTIHAHFLSTPRFAQANWTLNSAHNILLQLMLQAGWPYALLICAAAVTVATQAAPLLRRNWSRDASIILAILILILSNAMIDIVLDMPAGVTLFLFLSGLLWGRALQRPEIPVAAPHRDPAHDKIPIGR